MISETTYLGARMISGTLASYLADQLVSLDEHKRAQYSVPKASIIEAVIDSAFWASLRKEEGYTPKISIALSAPYDAIHPLVFKQAVRFTPTNLVKLSPAVIQPGIHLGVWIKGDDLFIWGTTHDIPEFCLVVEVIEPGLLVLKHKPHEGYGKFVNIAVLKGDQLKIIDEKRLGSPGFPDFISALISASPPSPSNDSVNVLLELAVAMRRHERGGLLLIVPNDDDGWRGSIVHPISYVLDPTYRALTALINAKEEGGIVPDWKEKIVKVIDVVGGFTAIDGATIITTNYELLAFGAKVGRAASSEPVPKVFVSEPIIGQEAEIMDPVKIGGTRHLAAAQFVHDQRNAVALVASQDGLFTVFSWSESLQMVHAHRVDTLLL